MAVSLDWGPVIGVLEVRIIVYGLLGAPHFWKLPYVFFFRRPCRCLYWFDKLFNVGLAAVCRGLAYGMQ